MLFKRKGSSADFLIGKFGKSTELYHSCFSNSSGSFQVHDKIVSLLQIRPRTYCIQVLFRPCSLREKSHQLTFLLKSLQSSLNSYQVFSVPVRAPSKNMTRL